MKAILILLFSLFLAPTQANEHEFYLSLTEIVYHQDTNELAIGIKIFYDDLQKVVFIEDGVELDANYKDNEKLIEDYLQRHFKLAVNNEAQALTLTSMTKELDALWCNFTTTTSQDIEHLEVTNSIFVDFIPRQSNIINFYPDAEHTNKVKGLLLNRHKKKGTITYKK